MFEEVQDLNIEAIVEIADIDVDTTKIGSRETDNYVSRCRRLYTHRTKNEERKIALGFFLSRMYFLDYKEINYLFRCMDTVKDVNITKKNNIIVAPYIILLNMASKGYKMTETMIELFFPEIYNEHSKKFRFRSQIRIIQEKLGYSISEYHVYEFELYYSTIALTMRNECSELYGIFDIRKECVLVSSLSEITYKIYLLNLKSNIIQWSISTGSIVNYFINIVLITIYELITKSINDNTILCCTLLTESELPNEMLRKRIEPLTRLISKIKSAKSYNVNIKNREHITKYFSFKTTY
ncbi:intermediate transcription factor VITF-3 [Cetacean poxvirus 1]|nr:intermediate transcription factor VITF-3 [Cetacean poxvirus 1]